MTLVAENAMAPMTISASMLESITDDEMAFMRSRDLTISTGMLESITDDEMALMRSRDGDDKHKTPSTSSESTAATPPRKQITPPPGLIGMDLPPGLSLPGHEAEEEPAPEPIFIQNTFIQ